MTIRVKAVILAHAVCVPHNTYMSEFCEATPTLDNYWRSIVLFGRNVASYKFALAKSL